MHHRFVVECNHNSSLKIAKRQNRITGTRTKLSIQLIPFRMTLLREVYDFIILNLPWQIIPKCSLRTHKFLLNLWKNRQTYTRQIENTVYHNNQYPLYIPPPKVASFERQHLAFRHQKITIVGIRNVNVKLPTMLGRSRGQWRDIRVFRR